MVSAGDAVRRCGGDRDAGINLFFLTFGMMARLLAANWLMSTLGLGGLRVQAGSCRR